MSEPASASTNATRSASAPDSLTSSPGATEIWEFNASDKSDFQLNSSGDVTAVLNSLNTSESLKATGGTPITLASNEGATGKLTELKFTPNSIAAGASDPKASYLDAGGVSGSAGSALVDLANSANIGSSGSFTAVIAMQISTSDVYAAGPIWGEPLADGTEYAQLRYNQSFDNNAGAQVVDGTASAAPQAPISTGWYVLTMVKDDGVVTYRLDGKTISSATIASSAAFKATDFLLGGGFPPTSAGVAENGVAPPYVGEFQAYSGTLSSVDLANAEYLAASSVGITIATEPTIAVSSPGTDQEASVGAGVTVKETITTTALSGSVYAEVLTASGSVETAYEGIAIASGGVTTASFHLAHTGDVIKVVNSTSNPTVSQTSTAVTITDPATTTLTGTLPSPLYTGTDTVTGTGGVAGLQLERITQGTYNTPGSTGWVKATVAANGTWSAQLAFTKAGMLAHVYAENGGSSTVVDLVNGTPVTPTPTPTPAPTPTPTPTFAATLPNPLYTGTETVTGTGGTAGLRLERITQGTYNTPGETGWVNATVAANGTWSVQLTFTKPGMLAHVYAQNGATGSVVDLVDGTPQSPPTASSAAKSVTCSLASDMTKHFAKDTAVSYTRAHHGGVWKTDISQATLHAILTDHFKLPTHS